jgi:hypothetical protein
MHKINTEHDRSLARRPYPPVSPPGRPRNLAGARSPRSSCASQWPAGLHALPGRRDRGRFAARTLPGMPRLAFTLCLPASGGQARRR